MAYLFSFVPVLLSFVFLWTLYALAKQQEKAVVTSRRRHELEHKSRDHLTSILTRHHEQNKKGIGSEYSDRDEAVDAPELIATLKDICNNLSVYFQKLTGDDQIDVSIRLARRKPPSGEQSSSHSFHYVTVARSNGLSADRASTSSPIEIDRGIPGFLRSDRIQQNGSGEGVLIYNDLKKATEDNNFVETYNDTKYAEDIKTMMVAPMNAWNGSACAMIGILYVSSKKTRTFKRKYVDEMLFAADHAAIISSSCLEFFNTHCKESLKSVKLDEAGKQLEQEHLVRKLLESQSEMLSTSSNQDPATEGEVNA